MKWSFYTRSGPIRCEVVWSGFHWSLLICGQIKHHGHSQHLLSHLWYNNSRYNKQAMRMRLLVKTQNNSSLNKFKNSVHFQKKNPRTHLGLFQPEKVGGYSYTCRCKYVEGLCKKLCRETERGYSNKLTANVASYLKKKQYNVSWTFMLLLKINHYPFMVSDDIKTENKILDFDKFWWHVKKSPYLNCMPLYTGEIYTNLNLRCWAIIATCQINAPKCTFIN